MGIMTKIAAKSGCVALLAFALLPAPASGALPSNDDLIFPLPTFAPKPSSWVPKFPYPYNQLRGDVTDDDIRAEGELCQWYNEQYQILRRQIDRLQFNRVTPFDSSGGGISGSGGDYNYSFGPIQDQVDIVTGNLDRANEFVEPRVLQLARGQVADYMGDLNFPLYESESFYRMWEHMRSINQGIKAHQADWFTGPSVLRLKVWGDRIMRSHVCDVTS